MLQVAYVGEDWIQVELWNGGMVEGAFAGLGLFLLIIFAGLLATAVLWFWAFITVIQRRQDWEYQNGTQVAWLLTLFFLGPVGPVLYLLFGHQR